MASENKLLFDNKNGEPRGNDDFTVVNNIDEEIFDGKCSAQLRRLSCSTWAVLMTELCERFSYYGIKAVLVLYLTQSLFMSHSRGKAVYHAFSMISYFTGVVGAIMADSLLGKFKTVVGSFVVYSFSEIVLTITSVPDIGQKSNVGPMIGLFTMAVACGNIKPCLGAFGGDQINKRDTKLVATFFSMFYMAVNVGAMFTMIFAPMLRTDIQCYGSDCYPVVFGVNSIIIIMATLFFLSGNSGYVKRKPEGNMVVKVSKMIFHALSEKRKSKGKGGKVKEYWLYYADDKYKRTDIDDVRALLKVLVMFIPLPVFWALFHQQGSSWTLQAEQMDGDLGKAGSLRSDQIQFFNPVLVLLLIPFYDAVIYPSLEKCNLKLSSLKKMVCGMILATIAFIMAGFLQMKIQDVQSPPPVMNNTASLNFINVSPCQFLVLQSGSKFSLALPYGHHSSYKIGVSIPGKMFINGTNCFSTSDNYASNVNITLKRGSYQSIFVDINDDGKFEVTVLEQKFPSVNLQKAVTRIRTIYAPSGNLSSVVSIKYTHPVFKQRSMEIKNLTAYDGTVQFIHPNKYLIEVLDSEGKSYSVKIHGGSSVKLGTFGEYTLSLKRPMHKKYSKDIVVHVYEDVKSTSVHRMWQLPQYIVITAGEIMFSVTGLEFSYSQAPQSMKSVLQSFWMLTTAFGDLIVVILSVSKPVNGVEKELFLYGGIMALVAIVFAAMCHFYTYNDFSGRNVSEPVEEEHEKEDLDANTTCL